MLQTPICVIHRTAESGTPFPKFDASIHPPLKEKERRRSDMLTDLYLKGSLVACYSHMHARSLAPLPGERRVWQAPASSAAHSSIIMLSIGEVSLIRWRMQRCRRHFRQDAAYYAADICRSSPGSDAGWALSADGTSVARQLVSKQLEPLRQHSPARPPPLTPCHALRALAQAPAHHSLFHY